MAIRSRIHQKYKGFPPEYFAGYAMRFGNVEAVFYSAHMQVDAKLCEPIPFKGPHEILFFSYAGLVTEADRCRALNYEVAHFDKVIQEWPTDHVTVSLLSSWAQRLPLHVEEPAANVSKSGAKRFAPIRRILRRGG